MKFSTQYLFGKPKSDYEPEQTILAEKKIRDGRALLQEIVAERDTLPPRSKEMEALIERYQAVERAIKHWREILNEGD